MIRTAIYKFRDNPRRKSPIKLCTKRSASLVDIKQHKGYSRLSYRRYSEEGGGGAPKIFQRGCSCCFLGLKFWVAEI